MELLQADLLYIGKALRPITCAIRGKLRHSSCQEEREAQGRIITTAIEHSSVLESCRSLEEEGYEKLVFIRPRDERMQTDDVIGAVNQDTPSGVLSWR
ncbi:MAG: hypothetical protein ACLTW9_00655 [Enterocloster sp.]